MAHVLPTGRNFYAVDPRALPSLASWQVGQGLADDLIKRYQREEGVYSESVGISIWGTSAMRTAGDDIAQVLALLGVRPRWQTENRRVIGVEVIPLAELRHPRIDVVCRISGFFRDAFPHLITLLDQAVQAVIDCDEAPEMNFPRKHALETEAGLRLVGLAEPVAAERARYRLFGCQPGSYGAGILPLIDAKNWQSDADFARAYLAWGGYAYSATAQGVPAHNEFASALHGVQVATKNQDNREHDIFDSDDYLQYHGGMIATVRALTGKNPRRYFGDSSNRRGCARAICARKRDGSFAAGWSTPNGWPVCGGTVTKGRSRSPPRSIISLATTPPPRCSTIGSITPWPRNICATRRCNNFLPRATRGPGRP
jgi:cobaltochelatase CobN